jgi:hypothetical protein
MRRNHVSSNGPRVDARVGKLEDKIYIEGLTTGLQFVANINGNS